MKLQVLSDQHTDFNKNYHYFQHRCKPLADTLIIAGDLHPHGSKRYNLINSLILPNWKNTIIIPGNHEFYGSDVNDDYFGSKRTVYTHPNGNKCYYVNNDVVEIDGLSFVCSTLWSHIGPISALKCQEAMNDYYSIRGNDVAKNNRCFANNCQFLTDSVKELDRCVVVTHHLPSFSLITDRYKGNSLNDAFAADMDSFLMEHSGKIPLWIHGHSHDYVDKYIYDTRCLRNPMGYPQERNGDLGCDMELVVEV